MLCGFCLAWGKKFSSLLPKLHHEIQSSWDVEEGGGRHTAMWGTQKISETLIMPSVSAIVRHCYAYRHEYAEMYVSSCCYSFFEAGYCTSQVGLKLAMYPRMTLNFRSSCSTSIVLWWQAFTTMSTWCWESNPRPCVCQTKFSTH